MSSAPWWSGIARVFAVAAGLVGLFVAGDALFVALLIVVGAVLGGALNPYTGLILFVIVPVLVAMGAGMAWLAYRLWRALPHASHASVVEAKTLVMRT
jgi:hypothetical protein